MGDDAAEVLLLYSLSLPYIPLQELFEDGARDAGRPMMESRDVGRPTCAK